MMNWVELNGATLRVDERGDGPETIVFVHEMGGSLDSFDSVFDLLAGRHHLMRYDQRGSGASEKVRGALSLDVMSEELEAVIAARCKGRPATVVGLALGGSIVIRLAVRKPRLIKALFLTAPAITLPAAARDTIRQRADRIEAEGLRPHLDERLAASYPAAIRDKADRFAFVRAQRMTQDPGSVAAAMRMLAAIDIVDDLAKVTQPVRILAGRHDGDRPPEVVQATTRGLPQAEVKVVDSGHFIPQHAPELFAQEIEEFVARNAAQR